MQETEQTEAKQVPSQFYLLHTLGCHLCEDALAMLAPMFKHFQLTWYHLDIAEPFSDASNNEITLDFSHRKSFSQRLTADDVDVAERLIAEFGMAIPVLYCVFNGESLYWPFDEEQVLHFWEEAFNP